MVQKFCPTEEQRRRAIFDLFYEIEQLIDASSFSVENRVVQNAILDSVLTHTRNLLDFYSRKKRTNRNGVEQDDVLVSDYGFPNRTVNIPSDVRKRLNKDLAHLTYDRSKRLTLEEKRWSYPPIVVPIMERSREFVIHVQTKCLNLIVPEHATAFVGECETVLRKIEGYLDRYSK